MSTEYSCILCLDSISDRWEGCVPSSNDLQSEKHITFIHIYIPPWAYNFRGGELIVTRVTIAVDVVVYYMAHCADGRHDYKIFLHHWHCDAAVTYLHITCFCLLQVDQLKTKIRHLMDLIASVERLRTSDRVEQWVVRRWLCWPHAEYQK